MAERKEMPLSGLDEQAGARNGTGEVLGVHAVRQQVLLAPPDPSRLADVRWRKAPGSVIRDQVIDEACGSLARTFEEHSVERGTHHRVTTVDRVGIVGVGGAPGD